jgi:hypothetical protein
MRVTLTVEPLAIKHFEGYENVRNVNITGAALMICYTVSTVLTGHRT